VFFGIFCCVITIQIYILDVVLRPGVSYIVVPDELRSIGLVIHTALRIFLCVACRANVLPNDIRGHFKSQHTMKCNIRIDDLQGLIKRYGIRSSAKAVHLPMSGGPPVELVPIIFDAFQCDIDQCDHVTLKVDSMRSHIRKDHNNRPRKTDNCYKTGITAQAVISGIGRRYFAINTALANKPANGVVDVILTSWLPTLKLGQKAMSSNNRETTPLLQKTEWHRRLQDFMMDENKFKLLLTLFDPPTVDEIGYDRIGKECFDYLVCGRTQARQIGLVALRVLMQGPTVLVRFQLRS